MLNTLIKLSMKDITIEEAIDLLEQNKKMLNGIIEKLQKLDVGTKYIQWNTKGQIYKNVAFYLIDDLKAKYDKFKNTIPKLKQVYKLINELDRIARSL